MVVLSCSKQQDKQYACDPELNEWTHNNAARFQNINRKDLSSFGTLDTQMAVYRSLSAEQQASIWIEKLNEVLSGYDLSHNEQAHVVLL